MPQLKKKIWKTEKVKEHKHTKVVSFHSIKTIVKFVGQMFLMDSFLGGQFSTYGFDVLRISGLEVIFKHNLISYKFYKIS